MHSLYLKTNLKFSKYSSVCCWVWVLNIERTLEQVLRQCINWIFRLVLADVMQTLCQVWHQIILKVLSDGLRFVVQNVFVLITVNLIALLSTGMLLLLQDFLQIFLLFAHQSLRNLLLCELDFVLEAALGLLLVVVGHVVVRLLVLYEEK